MDLTRQVAVKDQRQPVAGVDDEGVELRDCQRAILRQPVAVRPDDLNPVIPQKLRRSGCLDIGGLEHAHAPAVHVLQIPDAAAGLAIAAGQNGEPRALGKGGGLHAPAEPAKIVRRSLGQRIRTGRPHGPAKLRRGHTMAVVTDADFRKAVSEIAGQPELACAGLDAVIDQISECARQVVISEAPRRHHERGCIGRVLLESHESDTFRSFRPRILPNLAAHSCSWREANAPLCGYQPQVE